MGAARPQLGRRGAFLGPGRIVDVGSGAGLPGIVIAAMLPDREVVLVEPMERRVAWLEEAAAAIGLDNVTVTRARAEEVAGSLKADALTARAVASIDKLVKWCLPLLSETGHMALLKGRTAADEIERAKYVLRKAGLSAEILTAPTLAGSRAHHGGPHRPRIHESLETLLPRLSTGRRCLEGPVQAGVVHRERLAANPPQVECG